MSGYTGKELHDLSILRDSYTLFIHDDSRKETEFWRLYWSDDPTYLRAWISLYKATQNNNTRVVTNVSEEPAASK